MGWKASTAEVSRREEPVGQVEEHGEPAVAPTRPVVVERRPATGPMTTAPAVPVEAREHPAQGSVRVPVWGAAALGHPKE